MYSQQELDDAVASGVITAEAAAALRAHIEGQRSTTIPDEEQFRLITGFNDIFVSIAAAILMFAVGWIGQSIGQSGGLTIDQNGPTFVAPLFVAATAWALALYFTARRRMALPSILLLLAFVGGVFATSLFALILGLVLLLGVGMFLFAMWWDGSDRARITRRADVAFWLHLLAAPMIVHPVFTLLGLNSGTASLGEGLVVILLYVALGVTALAIDRRALLVSALAYVLYALNELFRQFGAVELNVALTALVIGSALLMLSAFWHQARSAIVKPLPESLRERLPLLDRTPMVATQQAA